MEHVTRTIYGSYLQSCLKLGIPHQILPYTTLNEKLGIQSNVQPPPGVYPTIGYYALGNKGHRSQIGANGIGLSIVEQHRATDAALFNQIPFVLREVTNDLTPFERTKYALRREETHNGIQHVAYYLKRIVKVDVIAEMQYRSYLNNTVTSTPFIPTVNNLNPTPVVIPDTGVTTLTGDYAVVSAQVDISLTEAEVAELVDVATILYNDSNYAIVSELAICSGVDKVVSITTAGVTSNFNEAIGVQIATHVAVMNNLKSSNTGVTRLLDFGTTDPLFNIA
jgi:hypothetical protein